MLIFLCCQRRLSPGILAVSEPYSSYQAANYSPISGCDDDSSEYGKCTIKSNGEKIMSSLKEGLVDPEWTTAEQTI